MTRTLLIALAAAAALAGCNKENHNLGPGGSAEDNSAAANSPVQLPPSIAASKSYRCKDNKLIYVDWMSDGSAQVKTSQEGAGTSVAAGSPELQGDAHASSISYKGQSCKA